MENTEVAEIQVDQTKNDLDQQQSCELHVEQSTHIATDIVNEDELLADDLSHSANTEGTTELLSTEAEEKADASNKQDLIQKAASVTPVKADNLPDSSIEQSEGKTLNLNDEPSPSSPQSQSEAFKSFLEKTVVQRDLSPVKEKGKGELEDNHLQKLCSSMFHKMTLYMHGEVESTVEDYALLERMNKVTAEKYKGMLQTSKNVGDSLRQINQKFVDLRPYLEQIEQIEQTVLSLEQAAYKLDSYTKKLEEKFRKLEKK